MWGIIVLVEAEFTDIFVARDVEKSRLLRERTLPSWFTFGVRKFFVNYQMC